VLALSNRELQYAWRAIRQPYDEPVVARIHEHSCQKPLYVHGAAIELSFHHV
jgi:hypothetical protein